MYIWVWGSGWIYQQTDSKPRFVGATTLYECVLGLKIRILGLKKDCIVAIRWGSLLGGYSLIVFYTGSGMCCLLIWKKEKKEKRGTTEQV